MSKQLGTFVAVDRVNMDVVRGEFFSLLGPSGTPVLHRDRLLMLVRSARWTLAVLALLCLCTACGTSGSKASQPSAGPSGPEASLPPAEGALRLLARQGYAEKAWVRPFERSTGCKVEVRYADSPQGLRRAADGWPFDVASIPGGLAYAVAEDGAARALNPDLVPQRASFRAPFRDPAAARAGTRRYGVSFLWSPRLLIWRHGIRKHAPATWGPLAWNTKKRLGRVSLENTPLQIGDAAIALRKLTPGLAIGDPYALDENQFAAATALTKRRMHLAGALWQLPGDQIDAFAGGLVDVGAGDWYTAAQIRDQNVDVGLTLPREGAPAEVDLWMLGARASHPGCAYRWMRYASGARVQAQVARYFGATPVNKDACALLGTAACRALHADAPKAVLNRFAFRHTPVENCGGGRRCVPFTRWEQVWSDLGGS